MHRAQMSLHSMSGRNVRRITRFALHLNFDPIGSSHCKIALDDWPCEVVYLPERVYSAIVKVRLPVPRRVSTGTGGAEHKELRVG